jgi:2'-5' RNA ligase
MTSSSTDHRQAAEAHVRRLIASFEAQPPTPERDRLIEECTALARAIAAFHMEGIRFRMFNVDRTLAAGVVPVPEGTAELFAEARRHLEAAGFQTRSHKAPGQ